MKSANRKKRPPLKPKRLAWAEARGSAVFKGTKIVRNAASESRLEKKLEFMIARMVRDTEHEIRKLWETPEGKKFIAQDASVSSTAKILLSTLSKRFDDWFRRNADEITEKWIDSTAKSVFTGLRESMKAATGGMILKTNSMSERIVNALRASVTQNVGLIKSIPSEYFEKIEGTVMRSIQAGGLGQKEIFEQITHIGHSTKKRAKLIANDQTSKATAAIGIAKMRDLGVDEFEWLHSGGGKEPRKLHRQLSGQIFSVDDPPVIDSRTGERGYPGQLINCRCTFRPVIKFDENYE